MFEKDYRKTHQINDEFFCLWCVEQDKNIASIRVWNKNSDKLPYLCCWEYSDANYSAPYIHDIHNMDISEGILEVIAIAFAKYDERFSERANKLCKSKIKDIKLNHGNIEKTMIDNDGGHDMNKNNIDLDVMDCITRALSAGADKDRVSDMLTHYLLNTTNVETTANTTNDIIAKEKDILHEEPNYNKHSLQDEQDKIRQERSSRRRQKLAKVLE